MNDKKRKAIEDLNKRLLEIRISLDNIRKLLNQNKDE